MHPPSPLQKLQLDALRSHVFIYGTGTMSGKRCSACKLLKEVSDFGRCSQAKDGLRWQCRSCRQAERLTENAKAARRNSQLKAKQDANSREKDRVRKATYRERHRDHLLCQHRRYRALHKNEATIYRRVRYQTDTSFKVINNLRGRVYKWLRCGGKKTESTLALCGCSIDELRQHLQNSMPFCGDEQMSFEKYEGLHIDHVIPLTYFDMTDPVDQRVACHYSNLQCLVQEDNLAKGNRLPWPKNEVDDYVQRRRQEIMSDLD